MVKYKNMLFGAMIFFILLVIAFIINIVYNSNKTIYIKDLSIYDDLYGNYEKRIEKLDVKDACSNSLSLMLKRIDDTHFTSNVSIKKYYDAYTKNDKMFINYYDEVIEACDITEDDIRYMEVLAAYQFPLEIRKEYLSSYQIKFNDFINEKELSEEVTELGSYNTKYYELKVMDELIKEVE